MDRFATLAMTVVEKAAKTILPPIALNRTIPEDFRLDHEETSIRSAFI